MRRIITTLLVLVLVFLFGWTVYQFVAKRAEEIKNTPDTAPALVAGAPVVANPATKPTATPAPIAVASKTPVASATKAPTVVAKNLPKTGPEDMGLIAGLVLGSTGMLAAASAIRSKRAIAKSYRSQVVL